jgi:hypothetical protein
MLRRISGRVRITNYRVYLCLIQVDYTPIKCIVVRGTREGIMLASIEKIDALVAGVTKAEIQRMPPAHRQRLAQVLRYIADLADPPKAEAPGLACSPSSETASGWNDIGMGRASATIP